MAHLKKTAWKKLRKGTSGLQFRVRDLVRKLRPDKVRGQLRLLLDQRWPPSSSATLKSVVECPGRACVDSAPDLPMSSQLAVTSVEEEVTGRNGSVRPSELSLVVAAGLAPPSPSHTPRNKSPVTVQEWVDSLPLTPTEITRVEEETEPRVVISQDTDDNLTLGAEAGLMCGPLPPAVQVTSCREPSESGSHCSSVESLLEARKPDPEEVLLSLGFGGGTQNSECRVPQRFLQPSRLKGVVIDDFLRHQHEMVQNFETGFCGYRGLSGPSHTMPSVIVAKIMEKLREHERESSVASPPLASANTDRNKFSRVARNVLTKIKCVPGTSVLTPDNRAWLDSQGHKSPEIGRRRIIIGHQSFTFSGDGDLIESQSPPSSLTDSDSRWTSSTGTPGQLKPEFSLDKPNFPSIQEDLTEPPLPLTPRHAFANVVTTLLAEKHQESKLSSSSMEVSDEDKLWSRSVGDSGLPSSGRSSRECDSPTNQVDDTTQPPGESHLTSIHEETKPFKCVTNSSDFNTSTDLQSDPSDKPWEKADSVANVKPVIGTINSLSENSGDGKVLSESSESVCEKFEVLENSFNSLPLSSDYSEDSTKLRDNNFGLVCEEIARVNDPNDLESSTESSEQTSLPSPKTLSLCRSLSPSPWPSLANELQSVAGLSALEQNELASAPAKVIQSLDKVIESLEKIMEPLEVFTETDFNLNSPARTPTDRGKILNCFHDLTQLVSQLTEVGVNVDIGAADQFLALTVEERCGVQCHVVRQALSVYQTQLSLDTSHYQLKSCLDTEVLRLSDLLDTASDPDKLSVLVQQMSELLKHQAELSSQLRQWSGERATCHAVCESVLRRLRALEHIVCRNTHALADLRNHV